MIFRGCWLLTIEETPFRWLYGPEDPLGFPKDFQKIPRGLPEEFPEDSPRVARYVLEEFPRIAWAGRPLHFAYMEEHLITHEKMEGVKRYGIVGDGMRQLNRVRNDGTV